MTKYLVIFALVTGALAIIFCLRTKILPGKQAIETLAVFLALPIFVIILDRFYAEGLLLAAVAANDPMLWLVRVTYALSVLSLGRGLYIIGLPFLATSVIIIFLVANELRPEPEPQIKEYSNHEGVMTSNNGNRTIENRDVEASTKSICVVPQMQVGQMEELTITEKRPRVTIQCFSARDKYIYGLSEAVIWIAGDGSIRDTLYPPENLPPGKTNSELVGNNIHLEALRHLGPGGLVLVTVTK